MPRGDLLESVLAALPDAADRVVMPDHPLLLKGPDILASFRGNLTAYFVVAAHTRQPAATILPKVVLTRLALPRTTSFVLVLPDHTAPINMIAPFFEEVVETLPSRRGQLPIGELASSPAMDLLEPLRIPHNERFVEAWSSIFRRTLRPRRISGVPTSGLRGERPKPTTGMAPYTDYHDGQYIFGQPHPDYGSRPRTWLSAASNLVVRADFLLDNGLDGLGQVARLTTSGDAYLSLHKSWLPVYIQPHEFDALKRFRAAAFAGIASEIQGEYVTQETH